MSKLFHVEHKFNYRPNNNSRIFISAGDTPGIRDACAMDRGWIRASF